MNETTSEGLTIGLDHWGDIVCLLLYFVLTMGVGIWAMCKTKKNSVQGFFLAGGKASWWQIGLSLFASNVSSEHFIGFAGAGAASGVAIVLIEWNAIFLILLLAWAFLPVYLVSGVYTLPEYLMRRFGGQRLRLLISMMFIISTVFVPADLYSGGIFIQQSLGWNLYAGVVAIVILAGLYSLFGGLLTVIYTDAIQVFIMLTGSLVLAVMAFIKVGGYSALREKYMHAIPASHSLNYTDLNATNITASQCGLPRADAWHVFRHPINSDYPSIAIFLRMSIGGVFYWCAHQTIVQRTLAAKNISHAKGGAILAGFLKLTPFFLMVLPGMISRVLYPEEVGCTDPETCLKVCGSAAGCSNIAYPRLVLGVLPIGMRGLMVAVMLSAAVSSLTSIYNSVATVTALDLWTRVRPGASEKELVFIGRLAVLVVICTSIAWIPVLQDSDGGQMIRYITAVFGYLGAPLSSTFLVAMFWKRCTEKGAFFGFVVSAICGGVRFILDTVYKQPRCGLPENRPMILSMVHPYYFTALQVFLGIIISVIVSLFTKPRSKEQMAGLTFWTVNDLNVPDAEEVQPEAVKMEMTEEEAVEDDATEAEEETSRYHAVVSFIKKALFSGEGEQKAQFHREPLQTRLAKLKENLKIKRFLDVLAVLLILSVIVLYIIFR